MNDKELLQLCAEIADTNNKLGMLEKESAFKAQELAFRHAEVERAASDISALQAQKEGGKVFLGQKATELMNEIPELAPGDGEKPEDALGRAVIYAMTKLRAADQDRRERGVAPPQG